MAFWQLPPMRGMATSPSLLRYLSVMAALALGLMAKPILVTWPLVFLLLDYWPLRRQFNSRLLLEKLPLCLLVALSAAVTFSRTGRLARWLRWNPHRWPSDWAGRLRSTLATLASPPGRMAWRPCTIRRPSQVIGRRSRRGCFSCSLPSALWGARRGQRWLAVGWLFYLSTLLPMIGLVQAGVQVMPDRSMYLPQIGIAIALAWSVTHLAGCGAMAL